MIRKLAILAIACSFAVSARAGELLDRIVATVNRHIVLQSDWDDAVRCEAFIAAKPLDQFTTDDRKGALDRLIDQELLKEQTRASDFQHVSVEEVSLRVQEVRTQYSAEAEGERWASLLARYGLTEGILRDHITSQLDLLRLVDARLRPTVQIDSRSIESYYNQELLPQLRQSGAKEVALSDVTPKIKEVLTQQKMNELLTAWLQNLRAGSEIHTATESGIRTQ